MPASAHSEAARTPLGRSVACLPLEADLVATRAWAAHVDAGRIGTPAPPPAARAELRLASLDAILGARRARIW